MEPPKAHGESSKFKTIRRERKQKRKNNHVDSQSDEHSYHLKNSQTHWKLPCGQRRKISGLDLNPPEGKGGDLKFVMGLTCIVME